nr:flagellar assembly protein FliW [uncultured Desulfuromonas sp.]
MKKINSRFGEIEYDPASVLTFPEGMIGFESLHEFVVMPNEKDGPLFWIQSVEDPEVALVLTDPTNFFLDYKVVPEAHECEKLGIEEEGACFSLVVVTVPEDKKITLNLAAPILFAPETNRAIQVILEKSGYDIRTPLPLVEKAQTQNETAAQG